MVDIVLKKLGSILMLITIGIVSLQASFPVDLRIMEIKMTPTKPMVSTDTASIGIRVKNIGTHRSSHKASLNAGIWSVDGQGNRINGTNVSMLFPSYSYNIPQLDPGQEIYLHTSYKFHHGGRHRVEAWINTEGFTAGEENAANNFTQKYFIVNERLADLVVCMKKYNHHTKSSRRYTYPPKVKNIGNAASQTTNLRFYIQGKGTKKYKIPALQPGEEYRGVQRSVYFVKKGTRKFQLSIDDKHVVQEGIKGERNNIINGKIFVNKYAPSHDTYYRTQCSNVPGMRDQ